MSTITASPAIDDTEYVIVHMPGGGRIVYVPESPVNPDLWVAYTPDGHLGDVFEHPRGAVAFLRGA